MRSIRSAFGNLGFAFAAMLFGVQSVDAASAPFLGLDVGNPGQSGTAIENGGALTLEGGGADIWGAADQFYLHHVTLVGDGRVVARVGSLENTDPWAKAGVMIRATSSAHSAHVFMGVTAANGLAFQRRAETGSESEHTGTAGTAPRWVRLTRMGNLVTAAHSADGIAWIPAGSVTLPLGEAALAGLAVTSHNNATLATAVFDKVEIQQGSANLQLQGSWSDNGNGDGRPNPGEEMTFSAYVLNSGTVEARSVTAVLNLNDPFTTLLASQADFGNIPAGGFSEFRIFRFRVSADAPENHSLAVPFEIKDDRGGIWTANYPFIITIPPTISGTVRLANGDPIGDAVVNCYNKASTHSQNTDAEGRYTLSLRYSGTYHCGVSHPNHLAPPGVYVRVPPSRTGVDFTLSATQTISGTVRLGNGNPAADVEVYCYNKGGRAFQNTDAQGRYTLTVPSPGSYRCRVTGGSEVVIGVPPSQTGVDFAISSAVVEMNHSGISDTLEAGQTRSHPVVISNPGDLPLEFKLVNPRSGYTWMDSDAPGGPAYAWTDIRTTGKRLNLTGGVSSQVAVQALSFAFPFYGTSQNTVYVTRYGYLTFVDQGDASLNRSLPSTLAPMSMIAPFWGHIDASAGAIYFQEFPDRAVFQYDQVPATYVTGTFTFQVVLYRDGTIRCYYNTLTDPSMGLVGMQNATGDKGFTLANPVSTLKEAFAVEFKPVADWLTPSPTSGTVAPGGSAMVHIGLDAGVLTAGTYQGQITLTHNSYGDPISLPVSLVVIGAPTGGLRREVWTGIPGSTLLDLTGNPDYPRNPSRVSSVSVFESPQDDGDNYGQRLRGYITPPTSGDYTFFIAGDDNCELRLSTDDHPGRAVLIARVPDWTGHREWSKYPEQRSTAIRLEAGKTYYVEVLHKDGGGGDHVSVGWQGPGITGEVERPIPASRLTPFDPAAWTGLDIGNPGRPGSQGLTGNVLSVTGSGADIWGAADQFRFVYRPLVGDGEITAQVTSIQNTDGWAKGGVMVRESLAADSRHAYTAVTAANGLAFQRRAETAGQSLHTGISGGSPRWVRLRREGNVFTSYVSMDGTAWTEVGRETLAMGTAAWVGLAVTSHNNAVTTTGTFESITVR